jgi:hypothetical protein
MLQVLAALLHGRTAKQTIACQMFQNQRGYSDEEKYPHISEVMPQPCNTLFCSLSPGVAVCPCRSNAEHRGLLSE